MRFLVLSLVLMAVSAVNAHSQSDLTRVLKGDRYLGSKSAPVKVVVYSSLTCAKCRDMHRTGLESLNSYIRSGDVAYIFRSFPLDGIAYRGALIANCARDNDGFFDRIDKIFAKQSKLKNYAMTDEESEMGLGRAFKNNIGITLEHYEQCVGDEQNQQFLIDVYNKAVEFGVKSTPSVFVDGEKLEDWRKVKSAVEAAL